jgi:phosphatidate cytidylyltransferase
MQRIITAIILVAGLLLVVKKTPAWVFEILFGAVICIGVLEAYELLRGKGYRPCRLQGILATLALVWMASSFAPPYRAEVPLVAAVILILVSPLFIRDDPEEMLACSMSTLFPVFCFGYMLSYLIAIRILPGETGEDLLLLLFVCVSFSDTGAFYVGTLFGRHRMAPGVSPKKSWEGAAGGLVAAVGGGLLAHFWFYQALPVFHAVILGLLLGSMGILGDLAESMLKRATGSKDSSGLLPGHGGVLDRVDSLIFSAPVLYYYYLFFLESLT